MMELLKKYWWLLILILVLPIIVNYILLIPALTKIVGSNTAWLSFWGNYLGAIISASVAFVILHIQRGDNEKQNDKNRSNNELLNEQNRVENEKQNDANRQLQLNIMRCQQQNRRLDDFKIASLNYCQTFNANNLIMISNMMWGMPQKALDHIKSIFDQQIITKTNLSFLRNQDESYTTLLNELTAIEMQFHSALSDIQNIVLYFIVTTHQFRSLDGFVNYTNGKQLQLSSNMQLIISNAKFIALSEELFSYIVINRIQEVEHCLRLVREKISIYIETEQERINNIPENLN